MRVEKQQLEHCMEQLIGLRSRKAYIRQGCLLPPCLFNLYTEHIVGNARLDESQAGIKTGERNINNFRYSNDNTLMAESEEELKNLLMRVKKKRERAGLKLNIKKLRSRHLPPSLHGS